MIRSLAVAVLLYMLNVTVAMAIEEPQYEVLLETPAYEVRRYAPYLVAEVVVHGDFREAGNEAFRILAAYIFGENVPNERMEMTAPVLSRTKAEGIRMAMPSPAISIAADPDNGTYTYGFVMEGKYTMETLPKPKDSRVRLRLEEPRIMAVRRYSGRWTRANYDRNESELLAALAAGGRQPLSEPILARYNSPFTPWFLRRNEVMVEIDWDQ